MNKNSGRTSRVRVGVAAVGAAVASGGACAQAASPEPPTQTVVVTATRHALLFNDAPAALSVVTARDIEARGAANVLEAIRGETGLSLQGRAVGGRKVLSLRGMDSRHALFLVDGKRIGASDGVIGASDFQYDWIAVDDIERIEIVRGPMSVLYGSEAIGGVVNVITRQAGDSWRFGALSEGSLTDTARGGDGWRLGARADGPLGADTFVRAGATARAIDAVAAPADARIDELEARRQRDAWLGIAWRGLPGHRFELEHRAGREDREANARERAGARRYHVTTNEIERAHSALSWDAEWAAAVETQLRAYRSTIDVVNRRSAGVTPNVPQRVTEDVLEGQARAPLGAHALLVGLEARNEGLDDPGLPGGSGVLRHRSLFAQDEWSPLQPLTLTVGLRHDTHGDYGDELSPRLYGVWRVDGFWTVKGGYSHGFKVPNLKQVVPGARPEGPNTFLGNPGLQPETSDSVELGVGFTNGARQAQLMLFDQRVKDLIEVRLVAPGPVPGIGTYTYENLARARLRGAELGLAWPLGAGFSAATSYTYLDATNALSGARLERRPRHSATVRVDWRGGPWRIGISIERSVDQLLPATTPNTPPQPVPGLTFVGAHVTVALPAGLEATLGVRNLTDVRLSEKSPLYTHAEAPRTWHVGLRGRW
ncbi:MAG: TonB-dependent receptor [Burkholderiaceae bacterium]|nr:TonB-dependent receptor [Burkholderiaceae bacterium]